MKDRTFQIITEQQRTMFAKFAERHSIPFQAVVGEIHKQRTIPANRRLWLLHTAASEVCGYTPEEAHEEMLCAHYGYTEKERINPWTGKRETKREPNKRSSTRDTKDFSKFMEFCENFYGETLGVWLP